MKIDSWDNEDAYFYIDYAQKWTKEYGGSSGTHVCGSSNTGWKEIWQDVTVTLDHFSPFTLLAWQSALSSAGTDESW